MNRRRVFGLMGVAIAIAICVIGLRFGLFPTAQPNQLVISAAASLKDALEDIKPLYQRSKTVDVTYNFGASGTLLQQIENGAPVDVFLSAANRQMDTLDQAGKLVSGTRKDIARNRLVLIVPKSFRRVQSLDSLKQPDIKRIAIGEPRSVPAGQYAEQVLSKLKLYDDLKPKFVFANNVRQVLAAVQSANAEAGFVYLTDAKISDQVEIALTADETDHSPIVYPVAVLRRSKHIETATEFVQYLSSTEAKTVLSKYGFIVPQS